MTIFLEFFSRKQHNNDKIYRETIFALDTISNRRLELVNNDLTSAFIRNGIEGKNSLSVNFIIIVLLSRENFEKYGQNWPSKPAAATIRCVQTSKHYLDVPKLITLTCDIVAYM